jgi:hypothetical protein
MDFRLTSAERLQTSLNMALQLIAAPIPGGYHLLYPASND